MENWKFDLQLFGAYAGTFVAADVKTAADGASIDTDNVFWDVTNDAIIVTAGASAGNTLMGTVSKSGSTYAFTLSSGTSTYTPGSVVANVTGGKDGLIVGTVTAVNDKATFTVDSTGATTLTSGTATALATGQKFSVASSKTLIFDGVTFAAGSVGSYSTTNTFTMTAGSATYSNSAAAVTDFVLGSGGP